MRNFCLAAMVCVIASSFVAPRAQAQCPAGIANPLFAINGMTWAFQTQDDARGDGAVGIFKAQVQQPTLTNPYLTGILTITMTSNAQGQVTVQQQVTGKYQIDSNCGGGELIFNANQNAYQYAFVFANGRTEMYLTSNSTDATGNKSEGPTSGNHGKAVLKTQLGCPTGLSDPLFLLNNTAWSFQTTDAFGSSIGSFSAQVLLPTSVNPYLTGALSVTETTSVRGVIYNEQTFPGRYQIYPDCSGGSILFNTNFNAYQYYFVFADNSTRMLLVSNATFSASTEVLAFDAAISALPITNIPLAGVPGNRGEARQF